jgi:hypothetical protein
MLQNCVTDLAIVDFVTPTSVFLIQVKSGEVHSVANVAFFLVQSSQPLEVRHYAFTLLQVSPASHRPGPMTRWWRVLEPTSALASGL